MTRKGYLTMMPWPIFLLEIQQVIWLRSLKLMSGGAAANVESFIMVIEKIGAAQEAAVGFMTRKSVNAVARGYRSKVRANVRRLSRKAK